MSKRIHVTPHPDGDWQVKKENAERVADIQLRVTRLVALVNKLFENEAK